MNRLTKYEITSVIGVRATQIANGSIPKIKSKNTDPRLIAIEELKNNVLPIIVVRSLPNGRKIELRCVDIDPLCILDL